MRLCCSCLRPSGAFCARRVLVVFSLINQVLTAAFCACAAVARVFGERFARKLYYLLAFSLILGLRVFALVVAVSCSRRGAGLIVNVFSDDIFSISSPACLPLRRSVPCLRSGARRNRNIQVGLLRLPQAHSLNPMPLTY